MMTAVRDATILLVDDQEANLDLLEAMLLDADYRHMVRVIDSRQALRQYDRAAPDLVILDLHMPHLNGFRIMEQLRERIAPDDYRPILVLTADATEQAKQRALEGGARDFLSKPLDPTEVQLRVRNLLETRLLHLTQRRARERAEWLAGVTRVLGHSLDRRTTLSTFANSVAPQLADSCWVDVRSGNELSFLCVAGVASDTNDDTGAGLLLPTHPWVQELLAGTAASAVLEWDAAAMNSGALHDRVAALAPAVVLAVPLAAGDTVLGATYLLLKDGCVPVKEDIELAREVSSRAAQAVLNAQLYQQAQDATRARDEVLAVVAHDLRNPLNTIRLATDMLAEQPESPDQPRTLAMINRSAKWMNTLIEDLLDVVRVESGVFQLHCRSEDVQAVLDEVRDTLQPLAAARRITLVQNPAPALPRVRLDRKRVLQVFSNLIGNAIKFTPPGGRITVSAECVDTFVRFSITDTGPGIAPEQLSHVFGRFWQGKSGDKRGIGLGLPLAKVLVEQHGGAIWAESTGLNGTIFHFTLPCEDDSAELAARPASPRMFQDEPEPSHLGD